MILCILMRIMYIVHRSVYDEENLTSFLCNDYNHNHLAIENIFKM